MFSSLVLNVKSTLCKFFIWGFLRRSVQGECQLPETIFEPSHLKTNHGAKYPSVPLTTSWRNKN